MPPSTNSSVALTKLLSSEARNTAALATSSTRPTRPSGTRLPRCPTSPSLCSGGTRPSSPGVRMGPGLSTLTRICRAFRSSIQERAKFRTATLKAPLDSPLLADFVANLDRINSVAEGSAGFVWRLQTTEGDATALRPLGDDTLVNMSVWKDVASLRNYVYPSAHTEVMRGRKEWLEHTAAA